MSRDKQIEEMAKDMLEASTSANAEPVLEIEGKEIVLGENATKILDNILEQAYIPFLAETLYAKGYRKASDVAREIFEVIENLFIKDNFRLICNRSAFAELKKKYTKEE